MANRRMISKTVIGHDVFMTLPLTTQALYFHLNLEADDDGFVGRPIATARMVGATAKDIELLIEKRYILKFDSGVIAIKHWLIHNTIRKDRHNKTSFDEELAMLNIKENKSYTELNGLIEAPEVEEPLQIDMMEAEFTEKEEVDPIPYKEIVDYLNEKCGTNFRHSGSKTQSSIRSRWNEGYKLDNFKTVIDKKSKEWLNGEMAVHLKPITLFGNKFDDYLNQLEKVVTKGNKHSKSTVEIPSWYDEEIEKKEPSKEAQERMDKILGKYEEDIVKF